MDKKSKNKISPEPINPIVTWNSNTSDSEFRGQLKEALKQNQHNNAGLQQIEKSLREIAYADLLETVKHELVIPAFILCSCLIEQILTFRYGSINIGSNEFQYFVKEYLPKYNGKALRDDLRNRLIHNFSLGETYILTHKNPNGHLKNYNSQREPIIKTILNLEDLVEDLGQALNTFCHQLKTDSQIRGNAQHSLQQYL